LDLAVLLTGFLGVVWLTASLIGILPYRTLWPGYRRYHGNTSLRHLRRGARARSIKT
jgi:hypothetical protein